MKLALTLSSTSAAFDTSRAMKSLTFSGQVNEFIFLFMLSIHCGIEVGTVPWNEKPQVLLHTLSEELNMLDQPFLQFSSINNIGKTVHYYAWQKNINFAFATVSQTLQTGSTLHIHVNIGTNTSHTDSSYSVTHSQRSQTMRSVSWSYQYWLNHHLWTKYRRQS